MAKFYDAAGTRWPVDFDEAAMARLAAEGITAESITDPHFWEGDDLGRIVRMFYCICEPQIVARGLTPEAFTALLARCIRPAGKAMLQAAKERARAARHTERN